MLSWVCFVAALGARCLSGWVPDVGLPRTFVPALTTPALALLGVVVSALGLRFGRRRSALVRVGLFLNAAVLLLSGLAALIFVWILGR
ncbi:MAG: hypothetical protein AAF604_10370 [Acidobacteriota bacterium]